METHLPSDFIFGVSTSAFQIEGGYNSGSEPKNNWFNWEKKGRVEPSGIAARFWDLWETYIDLAASLKINSFRLSIEWSRIEPDKGVIDKSAISKYKQILSALNEKGLKPLITLHHFCNPYFWGENFWLNTESPQIFSDWVKLAVENFGEFSNWWITLNEPNIFPSAAYLFGIFPPGKVGDIKSCLICYDNMLSAHVKAYEVIKKNQPDSVISTNVSSSSIYEFERLGTDVLISKNFVEDPNEIKEFLLDSRDNLYKNLRRPTILEEILRKLYFKAVDYHKILKSTKNLIFSSEYPFFLDVIQIDFYNPWAAFHVRMPFHKTAGGRYKLPARALWDDLVDPESFLEFIKASYIAPFKLWVVENGICNRVKNGRSYQRADGYTRPLLFKHYLPKLIEARNSGVELMGYWHWSLMDNYEWGSYEPRFGIYGIDRQRGAKILDTDAMGYDSAACYREMIESLRLKD